MTAVASLTRTMTSQEALTFFQKLTQAQQCGILTLLGSTDKTFQSRDDQKAENKAACITQVLA